MKVIQVFLLLILAFTTSQSAFSQCKIEDIFPIGIGVSKFQARTKMSYLKNYVENVRSSNSKYLNGYEKPSYLKGDSILNAFLSYDFDNHTCINRTHNQKNTLNFYFVDDKLYQTVVNFNFSSTDLNKCVEYYKSLITLFKQHYPIEKKYELTSLANETEQTGESIDFFKTVQDAKNKINHRLILEYSYKYYSSENKYYCKLKIVYINTSGTKLLKSFE